MGDIPGPMKTSLEHLPAHKRELLTAIARLLQESAPMEMLILLEGNCDQRRRRPARSRLPR